MTKSNENNVSNYSLLGNDNIRYCRVLACI